MNDSTPHPSGLDGTIVCEITTPILATKFNLYAFKGSYTLAQIEAWFISRGYTAESYTWTQHGRNLLIAYFDQHLRKPGAVRGPLVFLKPVCEDGRISVVLPSQRMLCTPLSTQEIEQAYLAQGHTIHIFVKG